MKKILKTIGFHKFKTEKTKPILEQLEGEEFLVWFFDGTAKECYNKEDLIAVLEKDNVKKIRYIFDMTDRIILDRDIKIVSDTTNKLEKRDKYE